MHLEGENVYLTELEQRNAGFKAPTVPLNAARTIAEQLLVECMPEITRYQQYADGKITLDDVPRAPMEAYRKQRIAQGLLDIIDLEFGIQE